MIGMVGHSFPTSMLCRVHALGYNCFKILIPQVECQIEFGVVGTLGQAPLATSIFESFLHHAIQILTFWLCAMEYKRWGALLGF